MNLNERHQMKIWDAYLKKAVPTSETDKPQKVEEPTPEEKERVLPMSYLNPNRIIGEEGVVKLDVHLTPLEVLIVEMTMIEVCKQALSGNGRVWYNRTESIQSSVPVTDAISVRDKLIKAANKIRNGWVS